MTLIIIVVQKSHYLCHLLILIQTEIPNLKMFWKIEILECEAKIGVMRASSNIAAHAHLCIYFTYVFE